ncbi:uncharacterized protein LOC123713501 isoform X1 [Pieris brassicae]|uniref:uncharacterized protein LOC123713501 isoform X1 n=2 Tax=Pieris brassicae TaxID=7116 RepID=UPI001E65ED1A|nr:uncharacterized protein LOC123713501 isoform X1 [Pieris brassicae]
MDNDTTAGLTTNEPTEMERLSVLEERVCPLCSSKINFFFINYFEKFLMCENTECEFPFGYEDLQFAKVDNPDNPETGSIRTKQSFSSPSSISGITVSDVDQLYQACESENNLPDQVPVSLSRPTRPRQSNILKNVAPLNSLHSEIMKMNSQMKISDLTDKKLIKNLYKLQNCTGAQLLKPQELTTLKRGECQKQTEVKININQMENDISVIKIELLSSEVSEG